VVRRLDSKRDTVQCRT